jgi:hypothetical protein
MVCGKTGVCGLAASLLLGSFIIFINRSARAGHRFWLRCGIDFALVQVRTCIWFLRLADMWYVSRKSIFAFMP